MQEKASGKKRTSIGKAVLSETLQHPATLFPAAGGVLALLYMFATGPSLEAFGAFLLSTGVAVSAWITNFFFRSDHFAEKIIARWRAEEAAAREARIEDLARRLQAAHLDKGYSALVQLRNRYARLVEILDRPGTPILGSEEFRAQALDMLENGLGLLERWLDLEAALETRRRIASEATLADALERKIAAQEEERLLAHRTELITSLERILKAFEEAILETSALPEELDVGGETGRVESSIEHFRTSLESAKRANAELVKLLRT